MDAGGAESPSEAVRVLKQLLIDESSLPTNEIRPKGEDYKFNGLSLRIKAQFSSWADTLSSTLRSESTLGYRGSGLALALISLVFATILCVTGAAPITGPWDTAVLLDGGWRILNGGVPHTDFHNPIGALPYLLIAFGMTLTAPSTSAIAYGTVLLLLLIAPLAWYIASTRLPWVIAFFFVFFIMLLLATPRPLGYEVRETTYAMIYNRESYVFFSLLLICVFLKPLDFTKNTIVFDGVLSGVLLALILYCKITYFIFASALTVFAAAVVNPQPPRWFLSFALAFICVLVGFFVVFDINPYSYMQDIAHSGQSQSFATRFQIFYKAVVGNATWTYILIVGLGVWASAENQLKEPRSPILVWLVAGSIIVAAQLISSGNAAQPDGRDDPLYFVAAVIALELFRRRNDREVAQRGTLVYFAHTASLMLLLPLFGGTILIRDFASCAYAAAWDLRKHPISKAAQLNSSSLRDFYVPASTQHVTAYWPARDYPKRINDGIELLEENRRNGDRVTTIAFGNPFSFALHLTPARDYYLWWDLGISFDQAHSPKAKEFLGDASIVMVPRQGDRAQGCCFETLDALLGLYGDYLDANFWEQASNDTWILYRRKERLGPG